LLYESQMGIARTNARKIVSGRVIHKIFCALILIIGIRDFFRVGKT
jgi:hypothetical protein